MADGRIFKQKRIRRRRKNKQKGLAETKRQLAHKTAVVAEGRKKHQ